MFLLLLFSNSYLLLIISKKLIPVFFDFKQFIILEDYMIVTYTGRITHPTIKYAF